MENPCAYLKDGILYQCEKRKAGCASKCKKWVEYVVEREELYLSRIQEHACSYEGNVKFIRQMVKKAKGRKIQ